MSTEAALPVFPPYRVLGVLGQGAMGIVYKAEGPDGLVAIKTFRQKPDDEALQRFVREGRALARLAHDNVVKGKLVEGTPPFIVMDYVEGEDLSALIKRAPRMSVAARLGLMVQIADGVAHAHEHGVIHRDLKPANVRVDLRGNVKVVDFGAARGEEAEPLTAVGEVVGTVAYMAPEQAQGNPEKRSDVFSLGALFYALLAYRAPFKGDSLVSTLYKIAYENPEPLSKLAPNVPEQLVSIISKALDKKPENRCDAGDLAHALRDVLESLDRPNLPGDLRAMWAEAALHQGVALLRDGRATEALEALERAQREYDRLVRVDGFPVSESLAEAHWITGVVCRRLGRGADAQAHDERAVRAGGRDFAQGLKAAGIWQTGDPVRASRAASAFLPGPEASAAGAPFDRIVATLDPEQRSLAEHVVETFAIEFLPQEVPSPPRRPTLGYTREQLDTMEVIFVEGAQGGLSRATLAAVWACLTALAPAERTVALSYYVLDQRPVAIARTLGLLPRHVEVLLASARRTVAPCVKGASTRQAQPSR